MGSIKEAPQLLSNSSMRIIKSTSCYLIREIDVQFHSNIYIFHTGRTWQEHQHFLGVSANTVMNQVQLLL